MFPTETEPIVQHWTPTETVTRPAGATAAEVCALLGQMEVADIEEAPLVPYLAAAAAELALVSGIPWRFSADDPPVALLRVIAKIALRHPQAGGPHTARALAQLQQRDAVSPPS